VFAPLHVLRHALPHLRAQRSGHIFNVASIVGFQGGYAGWSSYAATKFAVAGLTESLAAEVAELGIRVTVVYPGPVRTDFLAQGVLGVAKRSIPDYTEAQASLDLHLNGLHGQQAGDPEKVATLILQASRVAEPPIRLFAWQDRQHAGRAEDACDTQGSGRMARCRRCDRLYRLTVSRREPSGRRAFTALHS